METKGSFCFVIHDETFDIMSICILPHNKHELYYHCINDMWALLLLRQSDYYLIMTLTFPFRVSHPSPTCNFCCCFCSSKNLVSHLLRSQSDARLSRRVIKGRDATPQKTWRQSLEWSQRLLCLVCASDSSSRGVNSTKAAEDLTSSHHRAVCRSGHMERPPSAGVSGFDKVTCSWRGHADPVISPCAHTKSWTISRWQGGPWSPPSRPLCSFSGWLAMSSPSWFFVNLVRNKRKPRFTRWCVAWRSQTFSGPSWPARSPSPPTWRGLGPGRTRCASTLDLPSCSFLWRDSALSAPCRWRDTSP